MTDPLASRTVDRCRMCGSASLHRYLDLGRTPLANSYLNDKTRSQPEFTEELCLQLCRDCGLSQLTKVVHPDRMFRHYLYVSSTTITIREHFAEFAATVAKAADAKPGDLAVDIASNDGTLLAAFKAVGLKPLGVDPATNLAAEANAKGLTTWCDYWSVPLAERLARETGRPKVITAANVFAHADGLVDFARGVAACLAPGGVFAIECPYLVDFIEKSEFDTAYHEHVSYVGLTPLALLMKTHGLVLYDVEYFPDIHGGTIRSYVARAGERQATAKLTEFLRKEEAFGIRDPKVYDAFAARVLDNRERLRALVRRLRAEGKVVWAYGASAKGNTLMNFFGLDATLVPRAIDDNPKKWGYLTPGARMEIVGIDSLKSAKVDCLLLLAWNFEKEIRRRCRAAGYEGQFLVPVPEARLVSAN
ncbi:MAG: methyltransferase domain-containing protein [Elusimicrobia bacterium]|nr:methyltransferase domain-containing protein [Elusimicrobiota bacterium]